MTNPELLIAKRLEREMSRIANNGQRIANDTGQNSAPYKETMNFFMGMGFALAICFEELTGRESMKMKPQEIMLWARDLPEPQSRGKLV